MCKLCRESDGSYLNNNRLADSLLLEQANAKQGFLCAVKVDTRLEDGSQVYFLSDYDFLNQHEGKAPSTVHENLWEQAKLNMNYGLFLVSPQKEDGQDNLIPLKEGETYSVKTGDVFQIRGYDLASMTLVYDGSGWIVMDVLTTSEQAKAVWEKIVKKYFDLSDEESKINTVIYSHSHVDHYGGIGGLKEYFKKNDSNENDAVLLAPEGFTRYAVSENIYAGTAMKRRAIYQYGSNLPIGAEGCVDCGLGKAVSRGTSTILLPTHEVGMNNYLEGQKYCAYNATTRTILPKDWKAGASPDDLILQLQYTPGTEAPAEMNVYLPAQKILFIAENCAGTLHNTLTPRGAEVRDPLAWANFLDETLLTFSDLETVCSAHNWPHFGREDSVHFIEIQRDMYRYINNATLHLVNLGYTIDEVGRMISGEDGSMPLPEDFAGEWCCHGFYGTYNHDAKAVYQRYMGWYDGNPAHLNRHKPSDRATKYVKAFSESGGLPASAQKALEDKDYEWAAELYDYILNADSTVVSDDQLANAKTGYETALKQMGYRSESPSWRNMYLTAAQEVSAYCRSCENAGEIPYLAFENDTVNAMTLEMILQYMGIMLDSKAFAKAYPSAPLTMQFIAGGTEDAASTNIKAEYAKVTVNARRGVLDYRIMQEEEPEEAFMIHINGSKLSIFRAFVDHETEKLKEVIQDADERSTARCFITDCLTRFPLNFPIMTPRNTY